MEIDVKLWKENVFSAIEDLGDIKYQQKTWLGKNPKYVSSFYEDKAMLYENFCFANEFWVDKNIKNFGFSSQLISELRLLKQMIDNYTPKPNDKEILTDPEWLKITSQAKNVIKFWNR